MLLGVTLRYFLRYKAVDVHSAKGSELSARLAEVSVDDFLGTGDVLMQSVKGLLNVGNSGSSTSCVWLWLYCRSRYASWASLRAGLTAIGS